MRMISLIKNCIEQQLNKGNRKFIIFPFGEVGIEVKKILNECYGIEPEYVIDNHLCKYNSKIKPLSVLNDIDTEEYILILACGDSVKYEKIKNIAMEYISKEHIAEISTQKAINTKCGKYSYGPLCNHMGIESVGAFCGFADGCDVVGNHAVDYVSTHPIWDMGRSDIVAYDDYRDESWYFPGVNPRGEGHKTRMVNIGNDVWLGKNVIITNGAQIGNGVIAGAGSIITKDVPDYAVVVGVPARIIRYRYNPEQIEALNKIKWWDWSDELIRERHEDFYLPIEQFIEKYK